jgi:hypothetical protein
LTSQLKDNMPTYYARNISIRLLAADLAASTSASIHRARTGTNSQTEADRCEALFAEHGQPLLETPVPCDADERGLHLLETPTSPVPLLIVRADRTRLGPSRVSAANALAATPTPPKPIGTRSAARLSTPSPAVASPSDGPAPPPAIDPSAGPYALALRLVLPRSLFARDHGLRKPGGDVRYDVFFNGEPAASDMLTSGKLVSLYNGLPRALIGGKRVDFHVERPWIVVGAGQDAAGRLRERKSPRALTMGQRWREVNELVRGHVAETEILQGGLRSPVLECLYALAELEMPMALEAVPTTGQKPGIIDVVISTGVGFKGTSTPYLRVPEVMLNPKTSDGPSDGAAASPQTAPRILRIL